MDEHSPFDGAPDEELGRLLRDALEPPFGGAFVTRMRARLRAAAQPRSWDDQLSAWFWKGLLAASVVAILSGWGLGMVPRLEQPDTSTATASTASQLLEGSAPGTNVILASMAASETP